MKTRRLRLVRPKWTLGTMLLIVGWSAVVVWVNVRPRVVGRATSFLDEEEISATFVKYGYPWTYAHDLDFVASSPSHFRLAEALIYDNWAWPLAGNAAIGLLAIEILTFASKYLVRAIVPGLRALVGKPPPSNSEDPERASEGN
ncbi:MAG: hypothetical protein H8E44_27390 [Planctomycetes bacterium]|nr:hypothetical protein [Planctomycetota bacterium]MBL7044369.1 hypothetical protein [Pirellulaceae bacterium]